MTNFGNFGPILMKLGGGVYFILTNSILLSNTGTGKILLVRNSVVDHYTFQIFSGIFLNALFLIRLVTILVGWSLLCVMKSSKTYFSAGNYMCYSQIGYILNCPPEYGITRDKASFRDL